MPTTPMKATKLPEPNASREDYVARALEMITNTAPFDITHHPAMSLPCGMVDGLPVGLMLVGRHFDEIDHLSRRACLRAVRRLEEDVGARCDGMDRTSMDTLFVAAVRDPELRRDHRAGRAGARDHRQHDGDLQFRPGRVRAAWRLHHLSRAQQRACRSGSAWSPRRSWSARSASCWKRLDHPALLRRTDRRHARHLRAGADHPRDACAA